MPLRVNFNVLNQKGTPAFFSDVFTNRPTAGYAGRVFISTDTGAIYEDTGSAWTLIADAGAGTTGTLQQVTTNGNTTTQGISITTGGLSANTVSVIGGTSSQFLKANGTLDSSTYALDSTVVHLAGTETITGLKTITGGLICTPAPQFNGGVYLKEGVFSSASGFTGLMGNTDGIRVMLGNGVGYHYLHFPTATANDYTYPTNSGTLALTSDIPSLTGYVPYTGATTNLNLGTNNITSFSAIINGNGTTTGGVLSFKTTNSVSGGATGYTSLLALGDDRFGISFGTLAKAIYFNTTLIANSNSYTYYLAPYNGVLAMGSVGLTGYSSNPNTQFANAQFYSGLDSPAESHSFNIGIAGTAKANASVSTQWGVGVYGAGYTNGSTRSAGVEGDGEVTNSTDGGSAIGVRGYATATHSGGLNIGMLANASGSSTGNYGYYTDMAAAANTYANYHLGTAISYFGGKIGVGTNSPNALLDINGGDIYIRTGGVLATNTIDSYNTTLTIKSNGSNAIYIPATQNVLIGTTTDTGAKLQINATGINYANAGIYISTSGGTDGLAIGDNGASSYKSIQSFGGQPLVINSLGNNLLVGTTTDSGNGRLQVNGNVTFGAFGSVLTATTTNVTTSTVNVGNTTGSGIGCLYYAAWYNNSGGAQGVAILMVRGSTLVTVSISDGSGAAVVFSASSGMLRANTTVGSVTMGVSQINI